ncbi:type 1 glutamine amidotransferase domain-containing protein [Vibrio sp. MA64]|uniref:type 1 glutamine amidotransferase domain-containing protein n=1 Tax=Vibrio sp. MA64 TaxID=2896365 RepID=UPI001E627592|nr:type 1 glutamine amidotransferase domain-containing protein [Vibrio sp. MA64]MCC9650204.1 type 1 glutamine amidotransferase domain-containing protein [Vibrio sp. MA64]
MSKLTKSAVFIAAALLSANTYAESKGEVLVLLSSEQQMQLAGGELYKTGYYLNEFGVPADKLQQAGYKLILATPKGNAPVVDERSVQPMYFGGSVEEMERIKEVVANIDGIQDTLSFSEVISQGLDDYDAVFIPGGHAPLIDLANNPQVGAILRHFHEAGKPTAAICHGPIALLSGQEQPKAFEHALGTKEPVAAQDWIYDGYKMTIFSTPEEQVFESSLDGKKLRYYPADAMNSAGGSMSYAEEWQPHVVVDRELITGQNPFSDHELAKQLLLKLEN